jgi:hypothetical protein
MLKLWIHEGRALQTAKMPTVPGKRELRKGGIIPKKG